MLFLKVPKNQGEKIRQELIAEAIFDPTYPVLQEEDFLLFPVTRRYKDFELVERDAEKREQMPDNLKQALARTLSGDELQSITTSFDIIGDIAILEIPGELQEKEYEIADALLKIQKNVKCVFKKLGAMEGKFRIRRLQHLGGENRTETLYKEHGCQFKLDVSKVYFSVRLSHERGRIADLVKPNEKILVLFAGVGPFAIVIAKKHPDAEVTAVELNPDAVRYMKENIKLNRCSNVIAVEGDAADFQETGFDRIIMPLPHSAYEFMDTAKRAAKEGAVIHYYCIAGSDDPEGNALKKIDASGLRLVSSRIARPYSADLVQVVLDLVKTKD